MGRDWHSLPDYQSPARTRVLLALVGLHERDGRATVREIADLVGVSYSTCYAHLKALHRDGFVASAPLSGGTLRPLLQVVAHG